MRSGWYVQTSDVQEHEKKLDVIRQETETINEDFRTSAAEICGC